MSPEPTLDATLPALERLLCDAAAKRFTPKRSRRRWGIPVALFATLAVGTVALAASGQLGDTLADYFNRDSPPGRPLQSFDSPPAWLVADEQTGQRVIASSGHYSLYLARSSSGYYTFGLDDSVGIGDTAAGWRRQFADNSVVILGPGTRPDADRRVPLYGVTAGNVAEVEIQYEDGSAASASAKTGGFVLMIDPTNRPSQLVALGQGGDIVQTVPAHRYALEPAARQSERVHPTRPNDDRQIVVPEGSVDVG